MCVPLALPMPFVQTPVISCSDRSSVVVAGCCDSHPGVVQGSLPESIDVGRTTPLDSTHQHVHVRHPHRHHQQWTRCWELRGAASS